jgi:diadenosine tetraphosphate (Ap4A) HIT family hydrolase
MTATPCSICEQVAGRVAAPGGPIHDDGLWLVSHHPGPQTDPGELIVQTRRHCESLAALTPAEAAALGPVLRAAVAAVEGVVRPERTYVATYGERVRHVHFFVLPRTRALPPGHVVSDLYRKARMWLRRMGLARNPTTAERAQAAAGIREDAAWRRSST